MVGAEALKDTDGHGQREEEKPRDKKEGDNGRRRPAGSQAWGYRQLKTFQLARLVYDVTVRFCDRYVDRRSRTRDQMVQAARSGVQNIAEGSQASGTSRKMEMKLTSVARASLEAWPPEAPPLQRFRDRRCETLEEVQAWVGQERAQAAPGEPPPSSAQLAANAALSLINLCGHLLDRQLAALADAFEREGGFTERLHRKRQDRRKDEKRWRPALPRSFSSSV